MPLSCAETLGTTSDFSPLRAAAVHPTRSRPGGRAVSGLRLLMYLSTVLRRSYHIPVVHASVMCVGCIARIAKANTTRHEVHGVATADARRMQMRVHTGIIVGHGC